MISDQDLRALERYVLSDKNLTEGLSSLPLQSEVYLFLKNMHHLNQDGIDKIYQDKELKESLEVMVKRHGSELTQSVRIREILMNYDNATTDEERKIWVGHLSKYSIYSNDHAKPYNLKKIKKEEVKGSGGESSEEEDLFTSSCKDTLNTDTLFDREKLVNKLIADKNAQQIHQRYYPTIDYSKMDQKTNNQITLFLTNDIRNIDFQSATLNSEIGKIIKEQKYYSNVSYLTQFFGLSDLLELYKKHSLFQNNQVEQIIVSRQFYKEILNGDYQNYSYETKLQILQDIETFVLKNFSSFFGNKSDFERAIRSFRIHLLYQQNQYNDEMFSKYISSPHDRHYYFESSVDFSTSEWIQFLKKLDPTFNDPSLQQKIIDANLEHLYVHKGVDFVKKFQKYFTHDNLRRLKYQFDYLNNLKMDDDSTTLLQQVTDQLQDQTYITICHYNKKEFTIDEEIDIFVDLKNIPKLQVKVFEINTDNYFRKNMGPFSTDINLDGLIAKYEQEYVYKDKPSNLKHTENFYFPQFNKQRGLFILEFIGNGISSRAVVQKGSLQLIHKDTIAGHFAFILDENQKICTGQYTGLFFDNNFYAADLKGRIIIPFGRKSYSQKAIMIYEGFAQLTEFLRKDEQYSFKASIILHDESIIMGNVAKILVKPQLILNQRELADLKLLEDITITLQTQNKIDNISISKTYEDLKLNDEEEYELEFQVPPNIAEITVVVSAKVNAVSRGEKQSFSEQKTFVVNNHSQDFEFCEAFLRNVNGNYQYMIRGKNGEPKPRVLVDFSFTHAYYYTSVSSATMKTDKDGIIHLGHLKNITTISATCKQSRLMSRQTRSWILPKQNYISYPSNSLIIIEKESIKLPFKHSKVKATNVGLIQVCQNQYIENRFENVKHVANPKNKFGINHINISGLTEGHYQLTLKKENVVIPIIVHKGDFWNNSSDFILKHRNIIERGLMRTDGLRIDNVEVSNSEVDDEGKKRSVKKVKVELGGNFNGKKTRVHIWAFKFFPQDIQKQITQLLNNGEMLQANSRTFDFAKWNNFYLSNRQLSDENRYVMERKYQEKTIGNFLEKPTVLLKRNYIRDTSFAKEQLNVGGDYKKESASYQQQAQNVSQKRGMASSSLAQARASNQSGFSGIQGFQNFLAHSAEMYSNIKANVDQNGQAYAEFELSSSSYSTLMVVAVSEDQSTHSIVPLETIQIPKRDISLTHPYNIETSFAETRKTANTLKYDKYVIEDITSTDMQIVDSLQKVWTIQKELKKLPQKEVEFIETLMKWPTFNEEQRLKKYSEYCSHEFNLFLKMKDPQYFESVVKPFLKNKIEKTFVDYWLLDLEEAIAPFQQVHKLQTLNTFEICLLIQFLMTHGQEERAKELAQSLENQNVPAPIDVLNRIYDIVLNMNSLNSKPTNLDDIMDQYKKIKEDEMKRFPKNQEQKEQTSSNLNDGCYLFDDDDSDEEEEQQEKCYSMPSKECKKKKKSAPKAKEMAKAYMNYDEECEDDDMECLMDEDMGYESLAAIRQVQKPTFKELENTKEYAETQYYQVKERKASKDLLKINSFWSTLASHLVANQGKLADFLTSHFTQALSNVNEIALVIALTDLPFKEDSHGFRTNEGRGVEIKAACNMILFLKEISETDTNLNKELIIVHRYFEKDKKDREVEEFLVNEVYTCQVIITNISNASIKFQALTQIPQGSLPLNDTQYQKSHNFSLNPFQTMQFSFYFYFPETGSYAHFPTNVSINRQVVAKAQSNILRVKKVQTKINLEDFDDILATGSVPDILRFMKTKNIVQDKTFKFSDIYWLCKDPTFYKEGIQILREKNIYDKVFWSYSIYHKDQQGQQEFFNSDLSLKSKIGSDFDSKLVKVNNTEESHDIFNFLDYYPLVNARAHRVGGMDESSSSRSKETKQWILNENFRETYKKFIVFLIKKKQILGSDRLMLVNYLLMQERINDAIAQFSKIKNLEENQYGCAKMQYDYIKAYLDFYVKGVSGDIDFTETKALVDGYKKYPVLQQFIIYVISIYYSWRKIFTEISEQIGEIQDSYLKEHEEAKKEEVKIDNFEDTEKEAIKKQIKMEPQMDFTIENEIIHIDYVNVGKVKINYYLIDLEILFSKTPFLNQDTNDFSFVQPFASEELGLDLLLTNFKFPIPEDLAKKNLVIEISNSQSGIKQLKTYFSATLRVRVIENFGELKVFLPNTNGQDIPLPKTYVKVYQLKKNGLTLFFKDGYTDLRGRFDYGQLSGTSISDVQKFAIFVSNEDHGSLIKEAKPPSGSQK